jgi:hypothetical protein
LQMADHPPPAPFATPIAHSIGATHWTLTKGCLLDIWVVRWENQKFLIFNTWITKSSIDASI